MSGGRAVRTAAGERGISCLGRKRSGRKAGNAPAVPAALSEGLGLDGPGAAGPFSFLLKCRATQRSSRKGGRGPPLSKHRQRRLRCSHRAKDRNPPAETAAGSGRSLKSLVREQRTRRSLLFASFYSSAIGNRFTSPPWQAVHNRHACQTSCEFASVCPSTAQANIPVSPTFLRAGRAMPLGFFARASSIPSLRHSQGWQSSRPRTTGGNS